ncbi:MAG: hypothetical protein PHO32_03880 [Candidatus Cloacimonetes bacterium]|nr:hypothetical protein [Candidatus Cloacimonadota bacterium]
MKKIIILLSLSLWFVLGFSVALQHVPPQTYMYGKPVELTAEIQQGLEETTQVKLYFRVLGSEIWLAETMKPESKGAAFYRLTLPSRIITTEPIEYYFEVTTITGKLENFPALDGITPKFQLVPAPLEGEMSPGFIRLNDEPSISAEEGYLLAVSFFSIKDDIDLTSIEVWVNGRKVEAEIKSPLILFKDTKPLPGTKKAFVKCQLGTKSIHSDIWTTEVLPSSLKRAAPIEYNGTVNFASNVYGYSKKANAPGVTNSDAATWTDLYGSYGMADFQTNLYISSLEKSNQQPVNRYTFGVKIPHLEVFAGDYSPTLSQLTMNNKNIRGLYARTFNKYVSLTWAHGQSVRKTTSELDVSDASGIQKSGTFKQEAIGMRMQLGNSQETMLGVNLTRHRDIVSSLDSLYYMFTERDTIYTTPARDNAVASTDIRINMTDQNVILGAEVAASLLNKNTIPGAIDRETLESYTGNSVFVNPEDFSSLFVLNKNMEPLIPGKANVAWLVYLRTFFWNNFVNVQYSQTGSAFNALGASYQLNDSRSVVFTDQLNISRYFVLSGGLTHTADNLMNHKSETNKYTSWHFQSIIRPNKLPYL